MSSRALRKLQRKRDVVSSVVSVAHESSDRNSDSDAESVVTPKKNPFELLGSENSDEAAEESDSPVSVVQRPSTAPSNRKKKAAKKQSKQTLQQDNHDDIDKILKELHDEYGDIGLSTNAIEAVNMKTILDHHFAIDSRMLDADVEMSRVFGSKVVRDEIRAKKYAKTSKRTILVHCRQAWSKLSNTGISMEVVQTNSTIQPTVFSFVHSKAYQEGQRQFVQAIESHNPEALTTLLQFYPSNVDILLQLSEICKHQNEIASAGELVERALYTFERSFHSLFNISAGNCKISYDRVENRSFLICLYRHIEHLSRKGCWRTAFEFQKLLANIEVGNDSLCSLLFLDIYAIKSKEFVWYKKFWEDCAGEQKLHTLPNVAYSIALIHWELEREHGENHDFSSQLLQQAIARFPTTFNALTKDITSSQQIFVNSPFFYSYKEHGRTSESAFEMLGILYAEKATSVWKVPELLSWLNSQATIVSEDASLATPPKYIEDALQFRVLHPSTALPFLRNVYRIIFISDIRSLISYIPQTTSAEDMVMYDPFPPLNVEKSVYAEYRETLLNQHNEAGSGESYLDMTRRWFAGILARNNGNLEGEARHEENEDAHEEEIERDMNDDPHDEGMNVPNETSGLRSLFERIGLGGILGSTGASNDQHEATDEHPNNDVTD
ncbi:hypothetical protein QVD99_004004 [Batrachochytrium dendrobatidis]|nr:hypothetical protein O5D80_002281 [Batrachochytrium dendrobatidis]KAK5669614.1 hypothetical protein QVD99_004004 [Batrachochytrium dendrobatidis]